ncbi:MAG: type II toxin-antitoxin system Phd/YefM family antitoxin [Elusimicrobiota bacterium]
MVFNFNDDIRSVTDLKRHTKDILAQIHETGRPVVLTVNGRADAILIDAKTYEKYLKASNLSKMLVQAEQDIQSKRTTPMKKFLKSFKNAHKV